MKTINKILLSVGLSCWLASLSTLSAQTADSLTIIRRSQSIGVGGTNVLDTYLSAEHFSGFGLSALFTSEYERPGKNWTTLVEHEANFSSVKDRAHSEKELEGAYNFYWGRLRGWQLMQGRLRLQAGALGNASVGFIYNPTNSNNPAQARAHIMLMPTGVATYKFSLFRKPMTVRYELALPLVSIAFSPNYGQSYYEIFVRGNYDHNIVPTTIVSAPEFRQLLTLDAKLSRSLTMRIGYLGNYQQLQANELKQHIYTHRLLIGVVKRFSIIKK